MAANLSELLRVLLSAVCKYRLTLKTWFSSSLLILLDYGSLPVFPNTFFVLVVLHIHWLKESAERFWVSLIVNMWLPFKWAYYLTRRIFFPFQGLSRKSQITHAVIDFWTRAGSFHVFNCCRTELSMCFQLAVLRFFVT